MVLIEVSIAPLLVIQWYASTFITTACGAAEAIEFGLPGLIPDYSEEAQSFRNSYQAEIKVGSLSTCEGR